MHVFYVSQADPTLKRTINMVDAVDVSVAAIPNLSAANVQAALEVLASSSLRDLGSLPSSGSDLNTIKTPGLYKQPLNAGAAAGSNYPVAQAGVLEVLTWSSASVIQRYTPWTQSGADAVRPWVRSYYSISDSWSAWQALALKADASGFATAAQGVKADAALQPTSGVSRIDMNGLTWTNIASALAAIDYTAMLLGQVSSGPILAVSGASYIGVNSGKATIKRSSSGNFINAPNQEGTQWKNLTLNLNRATLGALPGHGISASGNDLIFDHLRIVDYGSDGIGGGAGILVFPKSGEAHAMRPRLSNSYLRSDVTSVIGLGWVAALSRFGFMSNIFVENAVNGIGYAHELKDNAQWNMQTGLTAVNCRWALAYGQESGVAPSRNIAQGVAAAACDNGWISGTNSTGNLLNGMIHDATGSPAVGTTSRGVHYSGGGNKYNATFGFLSLGSKTDSVRFDSSVNYAQLAAFDTAANIIYFGNGVVRCHADIVHPGERASVLSSVAYSGNPTKGSGACTVNSPATGERIGSRAGVFADYIDIISGAAWFSTQMWRYSAQTYVLHAGQTDGSIGNIMGIAHNVPGTANRGLFHHVLGSAPGADRWGVGGFGLTGYSYEFSSTSLRPAGGYDNTFSLGEAARRWATVYAANGNINTSDAREKTEPSSIPEAVLDAWGDVRLVAFQWLDAVASKGDMARVHHGVIAQQVRDVFEAHGLDGCRYGLLCYDEWGAEIETADEDGNVIQVARAAGSRWGVRPDQCLWVEAAYQRRRSDRIEARLSELESLLSRQTSAD